MRTPAQIQIKITNTVVGYDVGQVVSVNCDPEGTPLRFEWRRRLKDGACEIVIIAPKAHKVNKRRDKPATGDSEQ